MSFDHSSASGGGAVLDEEEGCIKVIATSLSQVSNRLNGVSTGIQEDLSGAGQPLVSSSEATEFVDMLARILAKSQSDIERLRVLAFEIDPRLVDVLVSLLQTPQVSIEGDPLALLFVSVCRCLVILLCACCKITAGTTDQLSAGEQYLGRLCCDIFDRCGTVVVLSSLLGPTSSNDVNYAASDCLFALLLRSPASREIALHGDSLTSLVSSLSSNSDAPFRANVSVCLRELANFPSPLMADNEQLQKVLVRVLALDPSADVRTMCIETLDVLYKRERQSWATCTIRKELATASVDRLERDESSEVLEAMSKLVETLLVADVFVANEEDSSNHPNQVDNHTFAETFIAISGDRALIQCCMLQGRVATLAARAFRTLVQRAPFYRYVPYNIFAHFPSLTVLLKKLIELNRGGEESGASSDKKEDTVLLQILKVELTMAFCVMLATDPRCRQVLASNLYEHPQWAQQLRAAILSHLQAAALEYFADIEIIDCTGNLVNCIDAVNWETDLRPTRSSVEKVFENQDDRWSTLTSGEEPAPRHMNPATTNDAVDRRAREMRLTYILLSYAAHCTLQDIVTPATQKAAAPSPTKSTRSPDRGPKGPLPTRTSILREWSAKPDKLAALKRAAANPDLIDRDGGQDSYQQALTEAGQQKPGSPRKNNHKSATFSKFDAALSLCTSFAQYYDRVGDPQPVIYETTADGHFARRQPHRAAWFGTSRAMKTKTWTLDTLREGDLFFFGIPITALNSFALEQVRNRAVRHMNHVKRSFVITPQNAKDRRWFLYDMLNHIMPGVVHALNELLDVFNQHGDEDAKFPIVMLRQQELSQSATPIQQDDTVHAGNLLDVIDQCQHYFRNMTDRKQEAHGGPAMSSQFLRDLEFKIKSLSTQEFSGNETNLRMDEDDRDDVESVDSVVSNAEPSGFSAAQRQMRGYGDDMSDISDY